MERHPGADSTIPEQRCKLMGVQKSCPGMLGYLSGNWTQWFPFCLSITLWIGMVVPRERQSPPDPVSVSSSLHSESHRLPSAHFFFAYLEIFSQTKFKTTVQWQGSLGRIPEHLHPGSWNFTPLLIAPTFPLCHPGNHHSALGFSVFVSDSSRVSLISLEHNVHSDHPCCYKMSGFPSFSWLN